MFLGPEVDLRPNPCQIKRPETWPMPKKRPNIPSPGNKGPKIATFRTISAHCTVCYQTRKKVGLEKIFHTSLHFMKWDEENCLRKFESIEKTFQLLPIWRAGGLPSKPFPLPPTSLYQSLHTQSIFQLLNLPKGKSIFNQLKMVLVSSNTCCCWVNTERKINFKKRQISDPYFKTVLWWVPTYLLA